MNYNKIIKGRRLIRHKQFQKLIKKCNAGRENIKFCFCFF